jgi:hypothetical protein
VRHGRGFLGDRVDPDVWKLAQRFETAAWFLGNRRRFIGQSALLRATGSQCYCNYRKTGVSETSARTS